MGSLDLSSKLEIHSSFGQEIETNQQIETGIPWIEILVCKQGTVLLDPASPTTRQGNNLHFDHVIDPANEFEPSCAHQLHYACSPLGILT
jgi:hypothetical protein